MIDVPKNTEISKIAHDTGIFTVFNFRKTSTQSLEKNNFSEIKNLKMAHGFITISPVEKIEISVEVKQYFIEGGGYKLID